MVVGVTGVLGVCGVLGEGVIVTWVVAVDGVLAVVGAEVCGVTAVVDGVLTVAEKHITRC